MGHRTRLDVWSAWLTAALWSATCAANPPGDPLPEALRTCSSIKRNSERLACYDRSVEQLSTSAPDSSVTFKPSPEAMFGTTSADARPAPSSTAERQELATLTARVSRLDRDGEGMYVIELDNGQSWRQLNGPKTLLLKEGDEVTISRGALNSFRLATRNGRAAKVRRIR